MSLGECCRTANVGKAHRLAAASIVGDRHHDGRDLPAVLAQHALERGKVHVSLERMVERGHAAFCNRNVQRLCAHRLDIAARRVEMGVRRDQVALLGDQREQQMLRCPALVGGNDVGKVHQVLHRSLEAVEARRARIALVAGHYRAPLRCAHCGGARVSQQIDDHIVRMQLEQIVTRCLQQALALLARGHADRLDGLDAERFNDGLHGSLPG